MSPQAPAPAGAPAGAQTLSQFPPYQPTRKIEEDRERARWRLAFVLTMTLAGTIAGAFLILAAHLAPEPEVKDLLVAAIGPLGALAGSALGFYFGGRIE